MSTPGLYLSIHYQSRGIDNSVANALSRIEANALFQETTPVIDFNLMAKAQQTDPELQNVLANPLTTTFTLYTSDIPLFCDTSTGIPRPFVPEQLRKLVFKSLHSLSHPGIRAPHQQPIRLAMYE